MSDATEHPDESLDPADWQALRALAHRAVDESFEYLATVRTRPVWQPVPEAVIERLKVPVPRRPPPTP